MTIRKLTAYLAIFLTVFGMQSAAAQSWTVGEVTPTWVYNVSTPWSPPIDPDAVHPADAHEPATSANDNVLYNRELWVSSSNERSQVGTADQAKFRTECRPSFIKRADPILFRGQYPAGHGHTFFGPNDPDVIADVENFDYAMGRANPSSACQGGPLNGTLYWEPSIYDERHGLRLTVMPTLATFYYAVNASEHEDLTHLRRNLRFIGGVDPMNFNDYARREELPTGLIYASTNTPAGFVGIQCFPGGGGTAATVLASHAVTFDSGTPRSTSARYLKGPLGEDPWGGTCTAGNIIIYVIAPDCWDGTNLASPNGRDHFRYGTRHQNLGATGQCPSNYVKVPHFETKVQVEHDGWTEDLQYWYFSSDRMDPAMTVEEFDPDTGLATCSNDPVTQGDDCSLDPCRKIGPYFCNGATAHFDWWGAWDNVTMEQWERNCIGLLIDGVETNYADCNNGAIDTNRTLHDTGTPPEAGLSSDPINSLPDERASASVQGQRYFAVNPDDQNQDALTLEVHPHD